jgi:hypothetical protein
MSAPEGFRPDLCRRLRWKGMFVDAEPDPSVPRASDGYCWCAKTAGFLGPDGRPAERENCTGGRSCYEAL